VVTGKPVGAGGWEGRDRATGFGGVISIKEWAKLKSYDLKGMRYIVQGFGNAGWWASHFMKKNGAILVGVQDASGTIYNAEGIDPDQLIEYAKGNNNNVEGYSGASPYPSSDFFALDCDIIIPAAMGNQITGENA